MYWYVVQNQVLPCISLKDGDQQLPLHYWVCTPSKRATIHQVTTMLATNKIILFPGHNHLLNTGTDDTALDVYVQAIIKVSINQY